MLLLVCLFSFLDTSASHEATIPEPQPDDDTTVTFQDVIDMQVGGSYTEPSLLTEPQPTPMLSEGATEAEAPLPQPDPQEVLEKRREKISRRVRFATNTEGEVQGDGGNDNVTSAPPTDINAEVIGLEGFSSEGFPRPTGFSAVGTIAINVTLDAGGKVISATLNASRSYGTISNDRRAVNACLSKAAQSKFKPLPSTTSGATGVIFYHFKKNINQ